MQFPEKLTFDDLLIVPAYSDIKDRGTEITTATSIGATALDIPFISAAMDTVTEEDMMIFMRSVGGLGIHHRYIDAPSSLFDAAEYGPIAVSSSMLKENFGFFDSLAGWYGRSSRILKIDVAHGDTERVLEFCKYLKSLGFIVWSGNVATVQAAYDYAMILDEDTDAITVGIGGGSACTTRIVSGVGYPQASAIQEIHDELPQFSLLSDGGIKNSADAAKALALGADAMIVGRLLAGTTQTPGDHWSDMHGNDFKSYRGMASLDALREAGKTVREEGVASTVPYMGDAKYAIQKLVGGIKISMNYVGARNLTEFRDKAEFVRITDAGRHEGQARI